MPKLENDTSFVTIDSHRYSKNHLNYYVDPEGKVFVYWGQQPQRVLYNGYFDKWTDSSDVAYGSLALLIADLDAFLFTVTIISTSSVPGLDISRGLVEGQSPVIIRGHNPSQTSDSGFVDVAENGDLTYLTTAEKMNIVSTSAEDGAGGSTGLLTILVMGVDNTGAAIQETISTNGTTDVLTTLDYLRVNFIIGLTVGSAGWNLGVITATAQTAGTVQTQMNATESISQSSHYTVPLNTTFYLMKVELNAAKDGGGTSPQMEFKGYFRSGGDGNAWLQGFDKKLDTSVVDELDVVLPIPTMMPARTDIRMRADTDKNLTECRTRMYGIIIDD